VLHVFEICIPVFISITWLDPWMIPGSLTDFMYELILHKMLTRQRVELVFIAWYTILANRHKTCSRTTECPIRKKTARGLATYINWLKYSVRLGCSKAGISWKSMFMTGLHVRGETVGWTACMFVFISVISLEKHGWHGSQIVTVAPSAPAHSCLTR